MLRSGFRHRRFPGFKWGRADSELQIGLGNKSVVFFRRGCQAAKNRPNRPQKRRSRPQHPRNVALIRNLLSQSAFSPRVYGKISDFVLPPHLRLFFLSSPKSEFCPFSAILHSAGLKVLHSVFRPRRFPAFKWGRVKSELRIGLANHSSIFL